MDAVPVAFGRLFTLNWHPASYRKGPTSCDFAIIVSGDRVATFCYRGCRGTLGFEDSHIEYASLMRTEWFPVFWSSDSVLLLVCNPTSTVSADGS